MKLEKIFKINKKKKLNYSTNNNHANIIMDTEKKMSLFIMLINAVNVIKLKNIRKKVNSFYF